MRHTIPFLLLAIVIIGSCSGRKPRRRIPRKRYLRVQLHRFSLHGVSGWQAYLKGPDLLKIKKNGTATMTICGTQNGVDWRRKLCYARKATHNIRKLSLEKTIRDPPLDPTYSGVTPIRGVHNPDLKVVMEMIRDYVLKDQITYRLRISVPGYASVELAIEKRTDKARGPARPRLSLPSVYDSECRPRGGLDISGVGIITFAAQGFRPAYSRTSVTLFWEKNGKIVKREHWYPGTTSHVNGCRLTLRAAPIGFKDAVADVKQMRKDSLSVRVILGRKQHSRHYTQTQTVIVNSHWEKRWKKLKWTNKSFQGPAK